MDSQIAIAISEEELENEIEDALSVQDTISDYKFMIMEALIMAAPNDQWPQVQSKEKNLRDPLKSFILLRSKQTIMMRIIDKPKNWGLKKKR